MFIWTVEDVVGAALLAIVLLIFLAAIIGSLLNMLVKWAKQKLNTDRSEG